MPKTHRPPSPIVVGDRVSGRCVTLGLNYTGTVVEVIPCRGWGFRYRLTDTRAFYFGGTPIEPMVEAAVRVADKP